MAKKNITVGAGDTYASIAKREFGDPTQYKAIMQANQQAGNKRLKSGQNITLPDMTPVQATPQLSPLAQAAQTRNAANYANQTNTPTVLPPTGAAPVQPAVTPPTSGALANAPAPALSMSGQTPLNVAQVTVPGSPNGVGEPNLNKPMYTGGEDTFRAFDQLKRGVLNPADTPTTTAQKEAYDMYANYNKYANADANTLLGAIKSGELTPDKSNLLWRALGQNGQPTDAMVQAYAMWDKGVKAGDMGNRTEDSFLGGNWKNISTVEEADKAINNFPEKDQASTPVVAGTSEYDTYRKAIMDMMGGAQGGASDYQGKLSSLRNQYNVQQDEEGLKTLDDQILAEENDLIARRNAQRSQPVAMGVIAGRVSEVERQAQERLNVLQRDRQYLANSLTQKQTIIGSMMDAYGADYEAAKENFDNNYNRQMQALEMFRSIRKDEKAEIAAEGKAKLDAQTAQDEKIQKRKDDAKAKLEVIYNAIGEGTYSKDSMSKDVQIQMAQLEVQAGYPIGTFLNMQNKNPDKSIKTTVETVNEKGERIISFVMQDAKTGMPSIINQNIGVDMKSLNEIKKAEQDLIKSKNENELFPLEKNMKNQQYMNAILTGQKSYIDIAKDMTATPSNIINPKASRYGVAISTDGTLVLDIKKNDKGEYRTIAGREQCGAFVNDALGLVAGSRMGDTLAEKVAVAKQKTPDVGSAFVREVPGVFKNNGHTGIVTKKYPDGSWDYINANEAGKGNGAITTGHMTVEDMNREGHKVLGYTAGYKNVLNTTTQDKPTDSQRKETEQKDIINKTYKFFDNPDVKGKDGKVSQETYKAAKRAWIANNVDSTPKEFDERFKEYINPNFYTEYGLDKSLLDAPYWEGEIDRFNKKNK